MAVVLDPAELAANTVLFSGVSPVEVESLLFRLNGVVKRYSKGDVIFNAGLEATRLAVVVSGRINIYEQTQEARQVLVREVGKDSVLGLMVMHTPGCKNWPGTAVATDETITISLDLKIAQNLIDRKDHEMLKLAPNISRLLAGELFATWRKLMVMDAASVEDKILIYLTELDNESGKTGEVTVPFDREKMAEYFGVTRPSLSRALGNLRKRGFLEWRKNRFKLLRT